MAWHLDAAVIRGTLDNRERGQVSGRVWLVGRDDPLELALAGDPWRDLAGRVLAFENPHPQALPFVAELTRVQAGVVGDCTASKKVKVLGSPEAAEHWRNGLQLEWFSADGRVAIESVTFRIDVSKESAWTMTLAEEALQRGENEKRRRRHVASLREDMDIGRTDTARQAPVDGLRAMWAGWHEDALADFAAAIEAAEVALASMPEGEGEIAKRRRKAVERLETIRSYLGDVSRAAAFCVNEGFFEARWGELVQARIESHVARIDGLLRGFQQAER